MEGMTDGRIIPERWIDGRTVRWMMDGWMVEGS